MWKKLLPITVLTFLFSLMAAGCLGRYITIENDTVHFEYCPSSGSEAKNFTNQTNLPVFSFDEDTATYKDRNPGVNPNPFENVDAHPIESKNSTIERAKNECTLEYDTTKVWYDASADIWRVQFYMSGTVGGDQTVYLDSDGKTVLVVYGE